MELSDRLCEMIRAHQVVTLRAREDPEGQWREVEPHAVYIGSTSADLSISTSAVVSAEAASFQAGAVSVCSM